MILFTVDKGTNGHVMGRCGLGIRPFTVRKDLVFDREELVLDPVVVNSKSSLFSLQLDLWYEQVTQILNISNDQVNAAISFAKQGNSVFLRDGYLLIIPFVNAPVMES
jgi:hypothetical protein